MFIDIDDVVIVNKMLDFGGIVMWFIVFFKIMD